MRTLGSRSALLGPILTFALVVSGCEAPSEAVAAGTPPALQRSTPEAVGMSSERLTRLHDGMQQLVDDGLLAGITTMVARRGQVVDCCFYRPRWNRYRAPHGPSSDHGLVVTPAKKRAP